MSDYTYRRIITDRKGAAIVIKEVNVPDEVVKQIKADAIDEFVTIIKERVGMDWEWDFMFIEQIAEQLKAGVTND